MKTTFRVTQTFEVSSTDVHTVEDYAMSHFGTTELPGHVRVEIVGNVPEADPSAPADQANATEADQKAEDDQPATDSPA